MPKVSVIIPTHNRAHFLLAALSSALNQTFQDLEVIVVDDASDDNTSQVVANFDDERIRYIRHEINKGGSAARNTGILASKCDYIAFLDDDDEWLPEKLAKQMAVLVGSPPDVGCVYTGYVTVDRGTGKVFGQHVPSRSGDLSRELLLANYVGSTSCVLLKRECLKKVGLFDEALPCCQDYDLWIRLAKEFRFERIQEPLLKYHFHKNKISHNLEALSKGLEILARKHNDSPLSKKFYCDRHLSLGVLHCYTGEMQKGKAAILRAIKLYPFEVRCYYNLFLSFLGAGAFRKLTDAKEALIFKIRERRLSLAAKG